MKDYSAMSDYEINLAVAHLVLGSGNYGCDPEKKEVYTAGVDGGELLPNGYFQPCNNPSDAWAIILENKISINHWCTGEWTADAIDGDFVFSDKPLRAAMIVYLQMMEQKK